MKTEIPLESTTSDLPMRDRLLANEIEILKKRLQYMQRITVGLGALLICIGLGGWIQRPGLIRGTGLEIVDAHGKVRVSISTSEDETVMNLVGAPVRRRGVASTPKIKIELGKTYQVIRLNDETGSLDIGSSRISMNDPKELNRVVLAREIPNMFRKTIGAAYLRLSNGGKITQVPAVIPRDAP